MDDSPIEMDTSNQRTEKKELLAQSRLLLLLQEKWETLTPDHKLLVARIAGYYNAPDKFMSLIEALMQQNVERRAFFFATVQTILTDQGMVFADAQGSFQ